MVGPGRRKVTARLCGGPQCGIAASVSADAMSLYTRPSPDGEHPTICWLTHEAAAGDLAAIAARLEVHRLAVYIPEATAEADGAVRFTYEREVAVF